MAIAKEAGTPATKKPVSKAAELEELNLLAQAGNEVEAEERAKTGGSNNFIKLVGDPQDSVLLKEKPEYIKGAKHKSFVISSKKINLGTEFTATIMGMVKVYEETTKKEGANDMAKILGYWHPEDAEQLPVEGIFDRPFPAVDGTMHMLRPVHWVFLRIDGFPDLEGATLAFRSTGNAIYKELEKLVKGASNIVPQLKVKVSSQFKDNEKFDKRLWYPKFEIISKNFEFEDGKVSKINPELEIEEVKYILHQYSELMTGYKSGKMVARKANILALTSGMDQPQAAIAGPKTTKGKGKAYEAEAESPDKF